MRTKTKLQYTLSGNTQRARHILRSNCVLKHMIEGKIREGTEVTGRQGRKSTQLSDELEEMRCFWKLNVEALDCTVWRTRCERGCGPVVRQTTERINIVKLVHHDIGLWSTSYKA
jgi:hypothetical protein